MDKNVICCGNIAFDVIQKPHKNGSISFSAYSGGSVFNTAIMLSRLGLNVSMLTKTGKDLLGDSLIDIMKHENINTRYVFQDKAIQTSLAFAKLDKKGDSSFSFYKHMGPENKFESVDLSKNVFKNASFFHTASGYTYADDTFSNSLNLLKKAEKNKIVTSYDPNWRENRIKNKSVAIKRIKSLLPYVNIFKLNDTDAMSITRKKTLSKALASLPKGSIVTLGKKGVFYWNGTKKYFVPSFKVKVIDTIGAGDAFTAGLIYCFLRYGKEAFYADIKRSLTFASACSALICLGHGASEGLRNLKQVNSFLALNV